MKDGSFSAWNPGIESEVPSEYRNLETIYDPGNVFGSYEEVEELAREIAEHIPQFTIGYSVDPVRQAIADSWPRHMDDTAARNEWGWRPEYDLVATVRAMLAELQAAQQQRGDDDRVE